MKMKMKFGAGMPQHANTEPGQPPKLPCAAGVKSKMSVHATLRLMQRTKLSLEELLNILDNTSGLEWTVRLGTRRKRKNREPEDTTVELILFYSLADRCCFVAIREVKSLTVITILNTDHKTGIPIPAHHIDRLTKYYRSMWPRPKATYVPPPMPPSEIQPPLI